MSHVTAMDDAQTLQNINFHSAEATKKDVMSGRSYICVILEGKCILRREPQNCLDYNFLWLISDHFDSGLYQDEKLSGS